MDPVEKRFKEFQCGWAILGNIGTQQYHHFSVVRGTSKVEARIMSGDDNFTVHQTCTSK